MRRSIRLAIAAGAALVSALVFAGSAWAAYAPSLTVTSLSERSRRSRRRSSWATSRRADDDPTAKDTIYAPLGYGVNLGQPAGTKIGDVSARLILRGGGNARSTSGTGHRRQPGSPHQQSSALRRSHGAVWKLNITVAGTPLTVPMYVDAVTAGPEAAFASAKIQLCLAGPIGTPAGAQLLFALFDVNGVFTNPSNTTDRVWRTPVHAVQRRVTTAAEPRRDDRGTGTRSGPRQPQDEGEEPEAGQRDHLRAAARRTGQPYRGGVVELYVGNKKVATDEDEQCGAIHLQEEDQEEDALSALADFESLISHCLPGTTATAACRRAARQRRSPSSPRQHRHGRDVSANTSKSRSGASVRGPRAFSYPGGHGRRPSASARARGPTRPCRSTGIRKACRRAERLRYYAEHFDTVEVDSTYYRLPDEEMVERWAERTPEGFVMHVKAFGVMTRHPVKVEQLPPDLRDEAPKDDRGRVDRPLA